MKQFLAYNHHSGEIWPPESRELACPSFPLPVKLLRKMQLKESPLPALPLALGLHSFRK